MAVTQLVEIGLWLANKNQWGLSYNNTEKPFSISFVTPFIAVCIGYEESVPGSGDGAPRVRVFNNEYIITNTGYSVWNTSNPSFFMALGT